MSNCDYAVALFIAPSINAGAEASQDLVPKVEK